MKKRESAPRRPMDVLYVKPIDVRPSIYPSLQTRPSRPVVEPSRRSILDAARSSSSRQALEDDDNALSRGFVRENDVRNC